MTKKNCMVVAEIGQAHDGSLGNAMAFIDALAEVGVDAVKFQCHAGDENNSVRAGVWLPQDTDRISYWYRTRFPWGAWALLRSRAEARGLQFGVSCFSEYAYTSMRGIGPDFWKIPLQINGLPPFQDNRPVVISTDFVGVVEYFGYEKGITRIHCSADYPSTVDVAGSGHVGQSVSAEPPFNPLRGMLSLAKPITKSVTCKGLSCHCPSIEPGIEAAKRGAEYIEYHVCWDRRQFGPDTTSSLTVDEFGELVKGVRACEE